MSPSDPTVAGEAALDAVRALDRYGVDLLALEQVPDTARMDPVPALTAFARVTRRLGLVAGSPVADQPPFLLARALGTLDLVSGGRSGWLVDESRPALVVTDDTERWQNAAGAGAEEWTQAVAEHVDVACALWNSWEPGAMVIDRDSEVFVDHTKVHTVHARGRYFSSRGPLNNPPPPQGRPVLMGFSQVGRPQPSAAVDVVVVRAAELGQVVELVTAVRADSPVPVVVPVVVGIPGTPAAEAVALRIDGDASTVATELSRLLEMTGADGVVLHGSLDPRTVHGTLGALVQEWGPGPTDTGHLRDRLLAFGPVVAEVDA